jgi:hypothetical protein
MFKMKNTAVYMVLRGSRVVDWVRRGVGVGPGVGSINAPNTCELKWLFIVFCSAQQIVLSKTDKYITFME